MNSRLFLGGFMPVYNRCLRNISISSSRAMPNPASGPVAFPSISQQIDILYSEQPPIPEYRARSDEPIDIKLARLLYQSRKRGMLENGLLLSSFADRFLRLLTPPQLEAYDKLINLPTNDWDIYYWISGLKPVPVNFQSDVMKMIQDFVKNEGQESRVRQPDLQETPRES